jgi:hypothetical protein
VSRSRSATVSARRSRDLGPQRRGLLGPREPAPATEIANLLDEGFAQSEHARGSQERDAVTKQKGTHDR